ncbi:hypothetical protein SK128_003044 [Halocaridina rubra]|uniref:Uncharacterized protein n=1 Tax=Halocaridina rubra TaxID=373956 RepID=A0AAN9A0Q6_HALRR
MDDTPENDLIPKEKGNAGKSDSSSDVFLKDSSCSRGNIPRVSLRLPFKSETFKAQSLLARFHSSRKSESGIKSDIRTFNSPWSGFRRGGNNPKLDTNPDSVSETEITSASLPDDLNEKSDVLSDTSICSSKSGPESALCEGGNKTETVFLSKEDAPFLPPEGQKSSESWFGTWPGRPRKLKGLKKRLLPSGGKNTSDAVDKKNGKLQAGEGNLSLDLDTLCDKFDQRNALEGPENGKFDEQDMNRSKKGPAEHVSLDTLLESLPLVYDPTTRQLHVGNANRKGYHDYTCHKTIMLKKKAHDYRSDCKVQDNVNEENLESDRNLFLEDESQQKEALLNSSEIGDSIFSCKHLEIIQEVDENSENARLMNKETPQSGNVSGSSSLERGAFESPRNSLQRASTTNSLSITDASSFSSLSSSNTELSAYSASDSAVCLTSHLSDTSSLRDFNLGEGETRRKEKESPTFIEMVFLFMRLGCLVNVYFISEVL